MGHLGFSYVGLIFLLLLFIPNLLWARDMPKEGDAPEKENRILRILERDDFYGRFLGIPYAGAVLPVLAFFLLGVYGKVVWMGLSAAILGIGHIGIHIQHGKALGKGGDA